mgnify:CR=1 FL=1
MRYMTPAELQSSGVLQEVNRLFFHRIGLALAVDPSTDLDKDGYMRVQVWDDRDDPEGWFFGSACDASKADSVQDLMASKLDVRIGVLGGDNADGVQPVDQAVRPEVSS